MPQATPASLISCLSQEWSTTRRSECHCYEHKLVGPHGVPGLGDPDAVTVVRCSYEVPRLQFLMAYYGLSAEALRPLSGATIVAEMQPVSPHIQRPRRLVNSQSRSMDMDRAFRG